jgi:hypothetical protein
MQLNNFGGSMKKIILVFSALILANSLLVGCVASGPQSLKTGDTRQCAKNCTYDGSFLAGRTYKTFAYIENISSKTAMKRAAQYTANDGWTIINMDSDMGIITATQSVSYGNGKTAPLNIGIEPHGGGVKVNMTYSTSGGVTSPLDSISNHFCSTIAAIEGK